MEKKRHFIELVKQVNEDETMETEVYFTPVFISTGLVYEAMDLEEESEEGEENTGLTERQLMDKYIDFIVHRLYQDQFTKEQFRDGVHGPDFVNVIREQIQFVASGYQSDAAKKFMEAERKKSKKKT